MTEEDVSRPAPQGGSGAAQRGAGKRGTAERAPLDLVLMLNHRLPAEALAAALSAAGSMRCRISSPEEEAETAEDPRLTGEHTVVLLELTPGDPAQEQLLERARSRYPGGRIIALAAASSPAAEVRALVRGVQGIFPMSSSLALLKKAVAAVSAGEVWADREITSLAISHLTAPPGKTPGKDEKALSRREREILALVAAGLKNRQIAERLFIAEQTVKVHLNRIFRKIDAADRLQAALYALHHGVVPHRVLPRS